MGEVLAERVPAPLREDPGLSIFGCAECGSPLGVFRIDQEVIAGGRRLGELQRAAALGGIAGPRSERESVIDTD